MRRDAYARRGRSRVPRSRARAPLPGAASLCVLLCLALGVADAGAAAPPAYPADAVKAAFLYRFTGFVDWPAPHDGPFTIAVLDAPAVADALAKLLPNQTVGGRPAYVRAIARVDEVGDAQVVFVGPGPESRLRDVARSLASRPVLVVADQPDALAAGAVLNFVVVERRVRFEVSLASAARNGLVLRSGLLSVAQRVEKG